MGENKDMAQQPGDRIEARCSRCSDCTGHIIMAIVNGEIVKVKCCACGSEHKYRPQRIAKKGQENTATTAVRRIGAGEDRKSVMAEAERPARAARPAAAPRVSAATRKAAQNSADAEQRWRKSLERPSAPEPRPYAITIELAAGDVVNHPVFGMGVVESVTRPDKAQILFRDSSRALRCTVA